jgi:enoyl-CoA hydratase/carnithine racemase
MNAKRTIKKVAVLGSNPMACGIACHLANAGLQVLLLDAAGTDAKTKNKPVNDALAVLLKSKPSPLYIKSFERRIATGNFEDDMPKIAGCDWVLEALDEQQDKLPIYRQVDQLRKPGTLITSQTLKSNGAIAELSEDFKTHFCIVRFHEPARYEPLLELVPTEQTSAEIVEFLTLYGGKYLGKEVVVEHGTGRESLFQNGSIFKQTQNEIFLDDLQPGPVIWSNKNAAIMDIGDGIINLQLYPSEADNFNEIIEGINYAITLTEESYKGLVIFNVRHNLYSNDDLFMVYKLVNSTNLSEIDKHIKEYQQAIMRVHQSAIPVVVAPGSSAVGIICQLCLHADKVVAHAELQMGLTEFKSGLIPFGGGTKEFALRLSDELQEGDIETNNFRERFLTLAQAKVSDSAYEAFELGYLKKGRDIVVMSRRRLFTEAKKQCLLLADKGYVQPVKRTDIRVLGKQALGVGYAGANNMFAGHYITERDKQLSQKLTFAMAGGDLSQPTLVSEDYLLALEREVFASLCAEPETLERIKNMLNEGKLLRN